VNQVFSGEPQAITGSILYVVIVKEALEENNHKSQVVMFISNLQKNIQDSKRTVFTN
jgi:hypothetical protein